MIGAELHSPLMDDTESTHAADIAEPTIAADISNSETQSIYAWSQSNDDETLAFQRRSWKLPVAVTMLTAAAAVGTGIYAWPEHKAAAPTRAQSAPPSAAPTALPSPPPVQAMDPDSRFIAVFRQRGGLVEPGREQMVINEARGACKRLAGENENQLIVDMLAGTPGMTRFTAELFSDSAIDVYCPQYTPQGKPGA